MGLGTAVEILAPPELREQMRVTAVELAAFYAQSRKMEIGRLGD